MTYRENPDWKDAQQRFTAASAATPMGRFAESCVAAVDMYRIEKAGEVSTSAAAPVADRREAAA